MAKMYNEPSAKSQNYLTKALPARKASGDAAAKEAAKGKLRQAAAMKKPKGK